MSKPVKILVFLTGYPSLAGTERERFNAFNEGQAHIRETFGNVTLDFICGVWDNIGTDVIKKEYKPLYLYSFSQAYFQAAIYPYIRQSLAENSNSFASYSLSFKKSNPDYTALTHRPLNRDLSQLFIRQQTIREALRCMPLEKLSEYSYFVYSRYDISTRGSEIVSTLPSLNDADIKNTFSATGRVVILPTFDQLNEGYPDMWFYFNLSGLIGYANIFDSYASSLNDPTCEYQRLFSGEWPYSDEINLYNFNDSRRFTNLELKRQSDCTSSAKYPRWMASNIHAFHKYFFALSPSPYVRAFYTSDAYHAKLNNITAKSDIILPGSYSKFTIIGASTMPLLVYTHSSYSDVFRIFLGEFLRYWGKSFSLIVACDAEGLGHIRLICSRFSKIDIRFVCYDDKLEYTSRVQWIMAELIEYQYLIFLHEDMIPTARPDMTVLDELRSYLIVNELPFLGITRNTTYENKERVSKNISRSATGYRYVVQPSFLCPKTWIDQLRVLPHPMSIWQLEDFFKTLPDTVYFCDQNGSTLRGQAHYETICLPHISTAITKGRWNLSEYPYEISRLSSRYTINLEIRGCI
jgi:hypothetical protein